LKSVTTATLDFCLKHDLPSDLAWTIVPPIGNPVSVPVGDSWRLKFRLKILVCSGSWVQYG
jgi:hypothetical protein